MQRRRPETLDGTAMLGGGVADMLRESPSGMALIDTPHVPISCLFGDHGSRCYSRAGGVALHHGSLLEPERSDGKAIAQADAAVASDAEQRLTQGRKVGDVQAASVDPRGTAGHD